MILHQGQNMTLNIHSSSLTQLLSACTKFEVAGCNSLWKICCVQFFSYRKKLIYQIWQCRKTGQGQQRAIIWTNYDGQESPPTPSFVVISQLVPENIFKGSYHMWAWGPSWWCDPDVANKFLFTLPNEAPQKNLPSISQVVLKMFEPKIDRCRSMGILQAHLWVRPMSLSVSWAKDCSTNQQMFMKQASNVIHSKDLLITTLLQMCF